MYSLVLKRFQRFFIKLYNNFKKGRNSWEWAIKEKTKILNQCLKDQGLNRYIEQLRAFEKIDAFSQLQPKNQNN